MRSTLNHNKKHLKHFCVRGEEHTIVKTLNLYETKKFKKKLHIYICVSSVEYHNCHISARKFTLKSCQSVRGETLENISELWKTRKLTLEELPKHICARGEGTYNKKSCERRGTHTQKFLIS